MENNCSICLEELGCKKIYITCCNHVFHDSCVQTWKTYQKRNKRTCPICRTQLLRLQDNIIINYNYKNYIKILSIISCVIYCILYFVKVREEIHDYSMCQWDAKQWCINQGYTWFKTENNAPFCNIDYCYRNTYFGY